MIKNNLKTVYYFLLFCSDKIRFLLSRKKTEVTLNAQCLCSSRDYTVVFEDGGFQLCRCRKCGLYRNYPLPVTGVCDDSYQSVNAIQSIHPHQTALLTALQTLKPAKQTTVLDIGCSSGNMLSVLKNAGYQDLSGLEQNAKAAQAASGKGLSIYSGFDQLPSGKTFDVIYLNHVIEHIENFQSFFSGLEKFVHSDTLLILATPNIDSFLARRRNWIGYQPDQHYWYFSLPTLSEHLKPYHWTLLSGSTMSRRLFDRLGVTGDCLLGIYEYQK